MERRTKYLFMISFDGLATLDFEFISSLPNFKEFIQNASYCNRVYSIYPSLTYPAHTTIVTGKYPKNHGVIDNTLLQPGRTSPDWYWRREHIKGETLYDLAIDSGMRVSALLWPVTAKSRIHYNMPEIFANRPYHNQILVSLFNGSPLYQFEMNRKFGTLRRGLKQPYLDNFTHASLLETIKNKKTDLTLVHYTDLDSIRHEFGFSSKEAKDALIRHDKRLGEIVKTLKDEGIYDDSTLVVLGDHSSIDEDKVICLNVLLRERGYIEVDERGRVKDYRVFVKSCDGSAYVYIKNKREIDEVKRLIEKFRSETNSIEEIISREKAEKLGADSSCALMLEAEKGWYFSSTITGEVIKKVKTGENGGAVWGTKSTHGYSPFKKDYTTVFMMSGKGVKSGAVVEEMKLVDEAPTIAAILGLKLKETDGRVIEEFFN